jgi:hypothetical protein
MIRTAAFVLLAVAAPCSAQRLDSLHPPNQLLHYTLAHIRPSVDPAEGTQYRYTADRGRVIDIFIYAAPDSGDPRALVENEGRAFVQWLRSGGPRPAFDLDSILTQASTSASARDSLLVPGFLIVALISRRDEQFLTYFHVLWIRGWLLKARATIRRPGYEPAFDDALSFTRDLMLSLLGSNH